MDEKLKKSVLQTLAYFDIFDCPLTSEELYHFLWQPDVESKYTEFVNQLQQLEHFEHLQHQKGFYFLQGREKIVGGRQKRVKFVEEKMKIARRGIKKLRWLPFVRSVFVCNTVASAGVTEESDVDVFIIVRKGRLWLTRLLVTLILSLFRLRRNKIKVKNKICLSFYTVDNCLNLKDVAIEGNDIYLMYWLAQLIPVYDPDNLLNNIQKENEWVKEYISSAFEPYDILYRWEVVDSKSSRGVKIFFEEMWSGGYGNMLNKQAKSVQLSKMKKNLESVQNEKDTRVVISDERLKFHENDRRREYREKWLETCQRLDVPG